jgi:diguanylate cyclase (GGDEF)-like protein
MTADPLLERFPAGTTLRPVQRVALTAVSLVLVAGVAWLDYVTGPHLSFGIFYLIPVGLCAWWGGFSYGILVALAGTYAWCLIDLVEGSMPSAAIGIWNGIVRFSTLALVTSLTSRLHNAVARERRLARTDPLTGAANGRIFYEAAAAAAAHARESAAPLTIAYLDLDDFKQVNDRLGHAAGDEVLQLVTKTVQDHLHARGLLARLGGDEFALLLPGVDFGSAASLIAKIHRALVRELRERGWPVSASIGAVTFLRPAWDVDRMVQCADAVMYGAKQKGKRRVEHTVVEPDGAGAPPNSWCGLERRASARALCNRTARVRPESEGGEPGETMAIAIVRDISPEGVGLHLETPYPPGTVLVIEPLAGGARTLLARVARVVEDKGGWLHGCLLATLATPEEIEQWMGTGNTLIEEPHRPFTPEDADSDPARPREIISTI